PMCSNLREKGYPRRTFKPKQETLFHDNDNRFIPTSPAIVYTTGSLLGKKTNFIQRQRQLTPEGFFQGLVFAQLAHCQASRYQIHEFVTYAGDNLTRQALDKRFTYRTMTFLEAMLGELLCLQVEDLQAQQGLLSYFNGVYVVDGTRLTCGEKLLTRLNLQIGCVTFERVGVNVHDNGVELAHQCLPKGSLRLADLGFFDLAHFEQDNQDGIYWISRYKTGTYLLSPQTQDPIDVLNLLQQHDCLYMPVLVGKDKQVPAYLVAQRVSEQTAQHRRDKHIHHSQRKQQAVSKTYLDLSEWTIYLTNIPDLEVEAIVALAHMRWQIENVFKLWKSEMGLDLPQSKDLIRQYCLFLAKLIAIWLAHALMSVASEVNRSWKRALRVIRQHALLAIFALTSYEAWVAFLDQLAISLQQLISMDKRKKRPLSFQALLKYP
ncbi:MAG: IS4 family transposase, partial [bacterium]|nr:IS4 family transposase [bacterium]